MEKQNRATRGPESGPEPLSGIMDPRYWSVAELVVDGLRAAVKEGKLTPEQSEEYIEAYQEKVKEGLKREDPS